MTSTSFSDIYEQAETGSANGIPGGVYDVSVEEARINPGSRQIWLDLRVLNGPAAGKPASVSLYFPKDGDKQGVYFHYRNKIAGFLGEDLKAAFVAADAAPTPEASYSIIAEALTGKQVTATITLNTEEGPYKGNNDLKSTKPLSGLAAAVAPQVTPVEANGEVTPAPAAAEAASGDVPF